MSRKITDFGGWRYHRFTRADELLLPGALKALLIAAIGIGCGENITGAAGTTVKSPEKHSVTSVFAV